MEDRYSFFNQGSGGVWRSFRNGDFQEGDVWAVLDGRKDSDLRIESPNQFSSPRILATASRVIPKPYKRTSGSHDDGNKVIQHSAPVNIPDWSKIYGKSSNKVSKKNSWLDADEVEEDDDCLHRGGDSNEDDDNLCDEDDYDGKLPPHEFLARRFSRSQISTFSVLEGAGRTLKGRDLSKVRNAILTKTGFLE